MASIGSSLEPCNYIIISGKIINDLSFSFIAPLQAKNYINHDILIFGTSSSVTLFLLLKLVHAASRYTCFYEAAPASWLFNCFYFLIIRSKSGGKNNLSNIKSHRIILAVSKEMLLPHYVFCNCSVKTG